jgi:arylsulfatase A-like enzyme
MSVAAVLQWTVVVAVATGLIEAATLAVRRHLQGRIIHQGDHYFWLAPLTNLVIFLVIGLGIAVAARLLPRWVNRRVVIWLLILVAMFALRLWGPRINIFAWLMLSAGVATVLSKLLVAKTSDSGRGLRLAALGSLGLCGLLMGAGLLNERRAEQQSLAGLPPAKPQQPNLLWLVLDTVPAKRMGLYGYSKPTTPQLDRFAERGVVFDRCIATSPWTLPGHGSMFTGFMPSDQTSDWELPMDDAHRTIAEELQQHGYATAGFAANSYYLSEEFGLARGFCHYREPRDWLMQAIQSSQLARSFATRMILPIWNGKVVGRKSAAQINRECVDWLAKRPADRPYFAFLNYIDTHGPYAPPPDFFEQFGSPRPINPFPNPTQLLRPDADQRLDVLTRAFEACLAYLDDQVGRLLADLAARGLMENTIVIITADHGEQLGENRLLNHANSLYSPLIHVPLIIVYPGRMPAGQRVDATVSYVDLPATITELLQLNPSTRFPGQSLLRWLDPAVQQAANSSQLAIAEVSPKPKDRMEAGDNVTPISRGRMRSAVSAEYHYILNGDGSEELYRFADDPEQTKNLVGDASAAAELERLRSVIREREPDVTTTTVSERNMP